MDKEQQLLLHILRASLNEDDGAFRGEYDGDLLTRMLRLASNHHVLPLVTEYLWQSSSGREPDEVYRRRARARTVGQAQCTADFLLLYSYLLQCGLSPAVMKGIVCRRLYPSPELRPSVDEDLLVTPEDYAALYDALTGYGLVPQEDAPTDRIPAEMTFKGAETGLYLEVHTCLIPPDNAAYGALNAFFDGVLDRTVTVQVQDVTLRTLSPTDHVLYLLCHAYKHFLHAGVGIRQVCDLGMMAREYDSQIDWGYILNCCRQVRMERFAAGLLRIGEKHLGFEMPEAFASVSVDEADLLEDILTGGLYGVDDINRAHTATITLDAVAAQRQGRRASGLLAAAFPARSSLEGRFPYLKEKPWLLPAAWVQRILRYLTHRDRNAPGTPSESLRIGAERVALLKQYGIID